MLPSSSPLLHTLKLRWKIPWDYDGFPHSSYSDLVAAINGIHLPVLVTFDLSVNLVPDDIHEYYSASLDFLPKTDFSAFLASHPILPN
jgi:hypothetical protein